MKAAFGMHLWPMIPSGQIASRPGTIMAGAIQFEVTVKGRGGHAAMPHLTADPVVAAAAIVTALQVRRGQQGNHSRVYVALGVSPAAMGPHSLVLPHAPATLPLIAAAADAGVAGDLPLWQLRGQRDAAGGRRRVQRHPRHCHAGGHRALHLGRGHAGGGWGRRVGEGVCVRAQMFFLTIAGNLKQPSRL